MSEQMTKEDVATLLASLAETLRKTKSVHWPIVMENDRDQDLGLFVVIWERHGEGRTVSSFRSETESVTFAAGAITARRRFWKPEGKRDTYTEPNVQVHLATDGKCSFCGREEDHTHEFVSAKGARNAETSASPLRKL